jgi:hypothetical protein
MDNENSYLFHGTGIYALSAIIAEDRLLEGHHWGHIDEPAGPRFSKRLDVAADFTLYKGNHIEGGVLVLDRSRLQVDYLLEGCVLPKDGSQAWGEESEIAAVTKVIEPLSEYLVAILLEPAFVEQAMQQGFAENCWNMGGWPDAFPADTRGLDRMHGLLSDLLRHPLLNAVGSDHDIPRHGIMDVPGKLSI